MSDKRPGNTPLVGFLTPDWQVSLGARLHVHQVLCLLILPNSTYLSILDDLSFTTISHSEVDERTGDEC